MPRPVKEEDFIEETDSGEDELEDDEEDSGPVFKLRERVPISSACNRLMSELNGTRSRPNANVMSLNYA